MSKASADKPRVILNCAILTISDSRTADDDTSGDYLATSLQADGHRVLAVGDGSNDAPLLAAADVSAALTSGTDLAQAQADLLLLDGRLEGLVEARTIAVRLHEVVGQSRRWALLYNLIAVPFAAFGLVSPWLAAIGMSLSSLVVVLNAMRVGRDRTTDPDRNHSGPAPVGEVSA